MTKNLIIISLLLLLTNCGISSSAFLGPVYTGAKTGSVYQTSLSYSSGKVVNTLNPKELINKINKKKKFINKNPILPDSPYVNEDPLILAAYKINNIDIKDITEIEHLP
jgi:hypothetical protein